MLIKFCFGLLGIQLVLYILAYTLKTIIHLRLGESSGGHEAATSPNSPAPLRSLLFPYLTTSLVSELPSFVAGVESGCRKITEGL